MQYPLGTLVRSIAGESDSNGETGQNAWGWIESHVTADTYGVNFPNGVRIILEQFEIEETRDYDVCPPNVMCERLKEIREINDGLNIREECPDGDTYNDVCAILGA